MHELILAKNIFDVCLSKINKQSQVKKIFLELGPSDHHHWSDLKSNLCFNFKLLSRGTNLKHALIVVKKSSRLDRDEWRLVKMEYL